MLAWSKWNNQIIIVTQPKSMDPTPLPIGDK